MKAATRIARLEVDADKLLRRIGTALTLYESERLRDAGSRVREALADLRLAKTGARVRPPEPPADFPC